MLPMKMLAARTEKGAKGMKKQKDRSLLWYVLMLVEVISYL
jgi:hypothetical protein